MSRVQIAEPMEAAYGQGLPAQVVTVFGSDGATPAHVYAAATGTTEVDATVGRIVCDAAGVANGWVEEGVYVLSATRNGQTKTKQIEALSASSVAGRLQTDGPVNIGTLRTIGFGPFQALGGNARVGLLDAKREYGVDPANTDNATQLQNFMNGIRDAGPSARGRLPYGVIQTSSPFIYTPGGTGLYVEGHGQGATTLKKMFDGSLVVMQGTGTGGLSETPHLKRFGFEKMSVDGNGHTGMLFDIVYANGMIMRDVSGANNNGPVWDISELWDSRLDHLDFVDCGDINGAACIFRNRRASGAGADAGGSNIIRVTDLRVENWKGGGLSLIDGTAGGTHMDHMWFRDIKLESHKVHGPAMLVTNYADFVYAGVVMVTMQEFDSGFSTPQIAVNYAPSIHGALTDCSIIGATAQSIDHGLDAWTGGDVAFDRIYGSYNSPGTPSSGVHVNFPGGGPYTVGDIANNGATTNVTAAAGVNFKGPGARNVYLARKQPATLTDGNDTAPVAGTVYYGHLELGGWDRVTGLSYLVGTVGATGNVIVALYDALGNVIFNSATAGTAVGTAAQWQRVPFTAVRVISPGRYWASVSFSTTAPRFRTHVAGGDHPSGSQTGTFGTLAAITPPTAFVANVAPFLMTY